MDNEAGDLVRVSVTDSSSRHKVVYQYKAYATNSEFTSKRHHIAKVAIKFWNNLFRPHHLYFWLVSCSIMTIAAVHVIQDAYPPSSMLLSMSVDVFHDTPECERASHGADAML